MTMTTRHTTGRLRRTGVAFLVIGALGTLGASDARAQAQCAAPLTSGLRLPLGIIQTDQRNLIVSESGLRDVPHSGRLSIVGLAGAHRTLVDGLPSGINDVGGPSGPAGLVMRGRTLYVAIGIGDTILPVGTTPFRIGNPTPSSFLFSSILAIRFSAHTERVTSGFSLTPADHEALAAGETLRLSNGGGDKVTIQLVANFPDYVPNPLPPAPDNVQGSNPFHLEVIGDRLYVTDGGRNHVWKTDIHTGAFAPLATFPAIPNPTTVGGPTIEAVPTGIREFEGRLFVTLFRGFPFAPGTSVIEQIDPRSGAHAPVLTGLRTAVDLLLVDNDQDERRHDDTRGSSSDDEERPSLMVLQHTSGPLLPPFSGPGSLTRFDAGNATVLANCLGLPTAMVRDERSGSIYITEQVNGRVVVVR
jgi:hypothetical protein